MSPAVTIMLCALAPSAAVLVVFAVDELVLTVLARRQERAEMAAQACLDAIDHLDPDVIAGATVTRPDVP